jgi:hypothetical protein
VLYDPDSLKEESFCTFTLAFTGYAMTAAPERVLVLQRGGGLALACAIASSSEQITVVEELPELARAVENHYREEALEVISTHGRSFLARSAESYDVIHLDHWGTSLPGMESLFQEHLLTREAFSAMIGRLSDEGILILSRRLLIPPADSLRIFSTALAALSGFGVEQPENHIAVLRSWDTYNMLVTKKPLGQRRTSALQTFAGDKSFDLVFYAGMPRELANRLNRFDEPYYYDAIQLLLSGRRLSEEYPLNIEVQTDDKPYHNRYMRWTRLRELLASTGNRLFSLLLAGEMVVALLFVAALLISFLLLFLPVILVTRKSPPLLLFFLCLGAGFMFVEMGLLKEFTFLLGDPVLAFSFMLAIILLFSGVGGALSDRISRKTFSILFVLLFALVLGLSLTLKLLIPLLLALPQALAVLFSALLLLPVSLLMGLPLPTAMRTLIKRPSGRAYGWAANGSASVLSSILAVQVSLSLGISSLFIAGSLAYLTALLAFLHFIRSNRR